MIIYVSRGHVVFRKDISRNGWGVALYTREVFNVIERAQMVPSELEAVCIEINKPKTKPIPVGKMASIQRRNDVTRRQVIYFSK